MRTTSFLCVLWIGSLAFAAPGEDPTGPRATLLRFDREVGPNQTDKALPLYYATTTRERALAAVLAQCDGALANLHAQAKAKYGQEIADAMIRSVNATTAADITAAKIKVNGDIASVAFPGSEHPATMVRVDGEWKLSVKAIAQDVTGNLRDFRKALSKLAVAANQVAGKIAGGQFPTAEEPAKALLEVYQKAFGG